ncbi:MAG: inositol monophosphatase [Planctomycetes bacterium]|nr:inositol monophosphatase [Planctomycetota bacterium]
MTVPAPADDDLRQRALAAALGAARDAGALLMEHFGRLRPEQVRSKQVERDLVTAADLASERLIVARLRQAFPEHAIEAEEETRDRPRAGDGAEWRWFLDPLDGTVNFVHQLPCFAVSLALYRGAIPQVGVVLAPRLGETFHAVRGKGAFLDGRPLSVSRTGELKHAILATGFPYRRDQPANNLENFGRFFHEIRGERRFGSAALDLCYVAAGRFDGYWELALSPHDVAAGALIVLEAGGRVSDAQGGQDWLRAGHIVASGPDLHEAIRSRVRVSEN